MNPNGEHLTLLIPLDFNENVLSDSFKLEDPIFYTFVSHLVIMSLKFAGGHGNNIATFPIL